MSVVFGLVLQFGLPVCSRTVDEKDSGTEVVFLLSQALWQGRRCHSGQPWSWRLPSRHYRYPSLHTSLHSHHVVQSHTLLYSHPSLHIFTFTSLHCHLLVHRHTLLHNHPSQLRSFDSYTVHLAVTAFPPVTLHFTDTLHFTVTVYFTWIVRFTLIICFAVTVHMNCPLHIDCSHELSTLIITSY